jgi:cell division protein FtsB
MRKLHKKAKYIIIFIIVFALSGKTLYNIIKNEYHLYKLKKHKSMLLEESKKLDEMIKYSNTKEFIEYTARVKLGLKKEDEIEYRFTPPQKDD